MQIVAVIPARFASTRLPGKPLLAETGKPLIQHVVEAARTAHQLDDVIVATDDERIADVVRSFCGEVRLTRSDHPSGTDRVAEVAHSIPDASIIVNLQGDEPEMSGDAIDRLIQVLLDDPEAPMATLCTPIRDRAIHHDPACVKVVVSARKRAMYFSRSPIPFHRDEAPSDGIYGYLHLGIYAYRRDFLLDLARQAPSSLELAERLEQLRVLEAGEAIAIDVVEEKSVGIDTREDYRQFVERWRLSQR